MIKKVIPVIGLLACLNLALPTQTYADPISSALAKNWATNFIDITDDSRINGLTIKKGEPYDEKKDPALRKGTENEEMEQGSFFAIPALVVGIVGILLWFNRDKG